MLNAIIAFSIRNKLLVGLFVAILIGYGVFEAQKLPIDAVPDITDNQVQVITMAPSFGATDIERLVTFPVEQSCSNINGIKEIRSFSRFGLSLVTIVFDDKTDVYWARQQVSERIQQVKSVIPQGIGTPELGPITTGLGEIYQYVVRPKPGYEKKYDITELRTIQDWIIRRQLLGVEGVAEVSSFGGKLKQYEVAVRPAQLKAYNISLQDVYDALEKNNQNTGGSYIEKGSTVLFIRSEGLLTGKDDIGDIKIKMLDSGTPLFIRNVADIQISHATRYGALCYNDQGEVAGAVVMMLKGANSNKVIRNIKARIEEVKKMLPEGVVLEPFLDRSKMVNNAIGTVEKNLLEGALIVIFILVIFLGNFRAGLLVASVIPLSMLFAIILMNFFGVSGNLMSLGALDFGLIVDGAVIIVEAVLHQLTHSKTYRHQARLGQPEMDAAVESSARKMMNSAVFGQMIILIVYLPIFSLQGIEGKMFKPMAQTVAFALLGAFVLSLTYIPMMSSVFLSKKTQTKPGYADRFMFFLEKIYQHTLAKALTIPGKLTSLVVVLFALAVLILSRMGGEFIPSLEEGDFAVDTRVLTGSNLQTTIHSTQQAASVLLKKFPEVEKVVTKIGSGEVPTDPMPMEASDMMVILKDKKKWKTASTFNELADTMSRALQDVPGITAGFQYPVQMRFNELMTGARQDVVCKIFGEDLDSLSSLAAKLGAFVNKVPGSQDLYIEPITGIPQIVVQYKRPLIAQYNLTIEDVNKVVHSAFAGQVAGQVFEGEKRFDLLVRFQTDQRKNLEDVQNVLIPTPHGEQVPLYILADVSIKNGPNQVQRQDSKRRIVVGFNVRGRDVESVVKDLQTRVADGLTLPAGYNITYGGAFENLKEAKNRLSIAVPVSLLLIFFLLYFAFNSIRQGLLIFTAIPLSAIGGIYFLALRGMPFSISAGIGFIALFGVAVLNGIVLVAEFNRLRKEGMTDLQRVVLMGTKVRLRPVLMTALVASLGFLPMALSKGAGAEVQRPLATVVIGGLLIATFLTLFVLPILYILFEKRGMKKNLSINKHLGVFWIMLLLLPGVSLAQRTISLEAARDSAMRNNAMVKAGRLQAEAQRQLIRSSFELPATSVQLEAGQFNSVYTDTKAGLSQTFYLPGYYRARKTLLESDWKQSTIDAGLREAEIRRNITALFYRIRVLKEREKLQQETDSLYREFDKLAALRFDKGETGLLEKSAAGLQYGNISFQLQETKREVAWLMRQWQLLLQTNAVLEPENGEALVDAGTLLHDTAVLSSHPVLKSMQQRIETAKAQKGWEKSRLMPELSLGYANASIRGTGADNKFYSSAYRFQSFQLGFGIPIFQQAQRAKIRSADTKIRQSETEYDAHRRQLEADWDMAWEAYQVASSQVQYYREKGLPLARQIDVTAERQFRQGEINYLEFVQLISQAYTARLSYLEAVHMFNESVIQINFLASKL